ncbi:MAG: large conductance mechanosensitive channel protein MscL [Lachnospiraceae bacterium]|nr:large conductance mechanosensitive channel protein MscL [Lachnospiraceae bacterium]
MKKFFDEYKKFISRGNVMDMAVGIIIGGAFTAIVNSVVNDIVMPLISVLTGGVDFAALSIKLSDAEDAASINYGAFIASIINFLLIAFVLFCIIKAMNKMRKPEPEAAPTEKECPYCKSKINIAATKCPCCTSDVE